MKDYPTKFQNLKGQRFGLLEVLDRASTAYEQDGTSRVQWYVKCHGCNGRFIVKARYLKRGRTSCKDSLCKMRAIKEHNEQVLQENVCV